MTQTPDVPPRPARARTVYGMLAIHGVVSQADAQALAACIVSHVPYRLEGKADLAWTLERLSSTDWWEFNGMPEGRLFEDLEALLVRMGLSWARVSQGDHKGESATLFHGHQADGSCTGVFLYHNDHLFLACEDIQPASLACVHVWQRWLRCRSLQVAPSAHAFLEMKGTPGWGMQVGWRQRTPTCCHGRPPLQRWPPWSFCGMSMPVPSPNRISRYATPTTPPSRITPTALR